MQNYVVKTTDPIVIKLIMELDSRSLVGLKKYGTSLADNVTDNFFQHAREEALDLALYLSKLEEDGNRQQGHARL